MELGIHLASYSYPNSPSLIGATLARVGQVAEGVGADSLWLMDHYFQMEQMAPVEDPMLEGYTVLGYLAAHTSTVRLGLLVSGVTYRHPGLLAKIVSTLDVVSGGRGELGIGAAWYEREHVGLGVPFPPVAERFGRLEEALQICLQMWDPNNNGPFKGRYYELAETICSPAPISRPRPPILIGGSGERKTLRFVARYADACNIIAVSPTEVAHKLEVLRRHCDDLGRGEASIAKTILYVGRSLADGNVSGFITEMAHYARLGVEHVIVIPAGDKPDVWIERFCTQLVPHLAELT